MSDQNGHSRPDYVRASKLRKRIAEGDELSEDDSAWFDSYEAAKKTPGRPTNASVSEKITYTEERAAAQGDHPHPIAYESMVRAEGLRADTLLRIAADSLVRCNDQYQRMMEHLLSRTTAIEDAHIAMLESVREHYIARAEAEAEAIKMQQLLETAGADGEPSELAQLLGYLMQAKAQKDAYEQTPEGKREKMKRVRQAKKKKTKPLGDPT